MKKLTLCRCVLVVFMSVVVAACGSEGGADGSSGSGSPAQGQRGSTARMALVDNYLYAISGNTIQLFDVENGDAPLAWTQVQLDWGIETIFPYQNYLLIGADNGVYILDNSDRAAPTLIGEFVHATAEDPVVARENLAYVTLRRDDTIAPNGIIDRLDVVDIADPSNPQLVHTIEMTGPQGLTVDGDRLHVCDGEAGVKTFSLENPREPNLMFSLPNDRCTDMLMVNDILVTIGEDGVSQYDVTMGRPVLMSELARETVIYLVEP